MDEDGAMVGQAIVAWAAEQGIVAKAGSNQAMGVNMEEVGNSIR